MCKHNVYLPREKEYDFALGIGMCSIAIKSDTKMKTNELICGMISILLTQHFWSTKGFFLLIYSLHTKAYLQIFISFVFAFILNGKSFHIYLKARIQSQRYFSYFKVKVFGIPKKKKHNLGNLRHCQGNRKYLKQIFFKPKG